MKQQVGSTVVAAGSTVEVAEEERRGSTAVEARRVGLIEAAGGSMAVGARG